MRSSCLSSLARLVLVECYHYRFFVILPVELDGRSFGHGRIVSESLLVAANRDGAKTNLFCPCLSAAGSAMAIAVAAAMDSIIIAFEQHLFASFSSAAIGDHSANLDAAGIVNASVTVRAITAIAIAAVNATIDAAVIITESSNVTPLTLIHAAIAVAMAIVTSGAVGIIVTTNGITRGNIAGSHVIGLDRLLLLLPNDGKFSNGFGRWKEIPIDSKSFWWIFVLFLLLLLVTLEERGCGLEWYISFALYSHSVLLRLGLVILIRKEGCVFGIASGLEYGARLLLQYLWMHLLRNV